MSASSFKFRTDPRDKKFIRLISKVHAEIEKAMSESGEDMATTKAELARKLGVNRSLLTRRLSGQSNMTLRTIADLAWALDRDIQFSMPAASDNRGNGTNRPEVNGAVKDDNGPTTWLGFTTVRVGDVAKTAADQKRDSSENVFMAVQL